MRDYRTCLEDDGSQINLSYWISAHMLCACVREKRTDALCVKYKSGISTT